LRKKVAEVEWGHLNLVAFCKTTIKLTHYQIETLNGAASRQIFFKEKARKGNKQRRRKSSVNDVAASVEIVVLWVRMKSSFIRATYFSEMGNNQSSCPLIIRISMTHV